MAGKSYMDGTEDVDMLWYLDEIAMKKDLDDIYWYYGGWGEKKVAEIAETINANYGVDFDDVEIKRDCPTMWYVAYENEDNLIGLLMNRDGIEEKTAKRMVKNFITELETCAREQMSGRLD